MSQARICDFCGKVTPSDDEKSTLFEVLIGPADSYELVSAKEKDLRFDAEDVCMDCTRRIHDALVELRRDLRRQPRKARTRR